MAFEYEETLQALRRQTARKRHLETTLESLRDQQRDLTEKLRRLDEQRRKEQADVERLEGHGLAAFFYGVTGRREEKLDRERQEAYAAAARYDVARRELDSVEEERSRAEAELKELRDCQDRYQALWERKAADIKASDRPESEAALALEARMDRAEDQCREIREAVAAGQWARSAAERILSSLDSAEGWGTWDLFGGGLLTNLAKHSHLDDAQRQVESLQVALRSFRTELADVTVSADIQVRIDGFLRFADYFFDGIFADWAVLDRIRKSQGQVLRTAGEVERILARLEEMLAEAEAEGAQARRELEELVLGTAL